MNNPQITIQDATEISKRAYIDKYGEGYGLMYPDGHVIRLYEKFMKYELGIDGSRGEKLLDFGCGNGVHSEYFASKGFEVYGVDVVPQAIEHAKKRLPKYEKNFVLIEPNQDIKELFDTTFDVLFANQSLYYLSNTNLARTLQQMESALNPGGVVYFTMIGTQNYYYKQSYEREFMDGLREVVLTGRLNDTTYIHFTTDEEDLKKKFRMFKPYFISYYDTAAREGSGFHYQFIGLKA